MVALICSACGERFAASDPLTGLADRAGFQAALAGCAELSGNDPAQVAVLLVDLDRFKAVNDQLGHGAGDALLGMVARRLRGAVRDGDVAARFGADEFAVLLAPPVTNETVAAIGTRIIELLSQPYMIDGCVATIGATVGAALGSPADSEALIHQADLAMYQAKSDGRGRFCFFEPELQLRAEGRRLLELDLRAAMALDQFELFYQPQMDLQRHRLVGFEALIRWRHPRRGLVPPDNFLPAAQDLGLLVEIGDWVLHTACAEAAGWPGEQCVAVNVAAQQFDNHRLLPAVQSALRRSGLPGHRLELEITETALLRSSEVVLSQLNAIKALGVQISLDDFGTGYSSLTQLRSFPFDRVKIDRSFVDDGAVVRAVAALGTSLGMRTTAEGIETSEQMTRLREDGCSDAQGYLLSRPVPASQVHALIARLTDTDSSKARHREKEHAA